MGLLEATKILVAAWLLTGCGTEGPHVNRVGLKPIDVRDGTAGDAIAADGTGDGVDGGGDGADGGGDGADGGGNDTLSVYKRTVYPLVGEWCKSCHESAQAPVFAAGDAQLAHDALLAAQKVDLAKPELSRLYLRLSKDEHNCPDIGCAKAAEQMLAAIGSWAEQLKQPDDTPVTAPTTAPRTLAQAAATRTESGLPPGVIMFEAEKATLKAPFAAVAVAGSGGGMVVQTPAGAGSQTNIATAAAQATLGTLTYTFDVKEAGSYRVIGRINAPANANSSFYLKMDTGNLLLWDFPASAANYVFDVADAAAAVGAPHQFNLTAGSHTIEIRQRQEQTKVDTVILTMDAGLDPASVKETPREVKTLEYDLEEMTGVAGAKLSVDVVDFSASAYLLKNPKLTVPAGSLKVKSVKPLVNGVFLPQHATWTVVDLTAPAPGQVLSAAALVMLKDKGTEQDEISFQFEVLEKAQ